MGNSGNLCHDMQYSTIEIGGFGNGLNGITYLVLLTCQMIAIQLYSFLRNVLKIVSLWMYSEKNIFNVASNISKTVKCEYIKI